MPFRRTPTLVLFITLASALFAQNLKQAAVAFKNSASQLQPWNIETPAMQQSSADAHQSGVYQLMLKKEQGLFNPALTRSATSDSILIIGDVPGETLTITGDWTCPCEILVFGDGTLTFHNANATIYGNLSVWGETAAIYADSSTLHLPQAYFYHRAIVAAGAGKIDMRNTTLDFSGLSHSMVVTDSSSVYFKNVTKIGFTTNGVYGTSTYTIDGTNLAGEFVTTDHCTLSFRNANTVLLWHVIPEEAVFHFNFPPKGNVDSFTLTPATAGLSGIKYTINLQNCTDVMWALMPRNGSDVEINNSELRAIGLWFMLPESIEVSGLVNNSTYPDFTASLADRSLHLINSSVQTWSLYPMRQSIVNVTGCILGEIGSMGTSQVTTTSVYVDGSGGYMWASDTSFFMAFNTPLTTAVRSERNGIMFYAYSPMSSGTATALGNSYLFCIQSNLPEPPQPYDNACVWNLNIAAPSSAATNGVVPLHGDACIHKTATSPYPGMAWYRLYYSLPPDTLRHPVTPPITEGVYDGTLALWNTAGLEPGQYLLHLEVANSAADTITVEAVKNITLYPGTLGEAQKTSCSTSIYPNPASNVLYINQSAAHARATLTDATGKTLLSASLAQGSNTINTSALSPGVYLLTITHNTGFTECKKVVVR